MTPVADAVRHQLSNTQSAQIPCGALHGQASTNASGSTLAYAGWRSWADRTNWAQSTPMVAVKPSRWAMRGGHAAYSCADGAAILQSPLPPARFGASGALYLVVNKPAGKFRVAITAASGRRACREFGGNCWRRLPLSRMSFLYGCRHPGAGLHAPRCLVSTDNGKRASVLRRNFTARSRQKNLISTP